MTCRVMRKEDIAAVIPLYIDYYNQVEGGQWTEETAFRRIWQVLGAPDSCCLLAEEEGAPIGFAIGRFEQYDDLMAYDLVEIVMETSSQNQGLGTVFLLELERHVKELGAAMVQLQAVNDPAHEHFYGKLNYKTANNLVLKTKWL